MPTVIGILTYISWIHDRFSVVNSENYINSGYFDINEQLNLSLVMRKPAFCICENKDADQLRGNREADQRLCFRYTDGTIPLPLKSEISSLWPFSVTVQPVLCRTWSETPKTCFLTTRLISCSAELSMIEVL